ncbi:MAG: hypothetical protein Q9169_006320 [Polycauliona sp. 2 TL-2023]
MPSREQIIRWLGCLITFDSSSDRIQISHFSIEEYLRIDSEQLDNSVARQYLVHPADRSYEASVVLICLIHDRFKDIKCTTWDECSVLDHTEPLYRHMAFHAGEYLAIADSLGTEEDRHLLQQFLSIPTCRSFELWDTYMTWHQMVRVPLERQNYRPQFDLPQKVRSPLDFASYNRLAGSFQTILDQQKVLGYDHTNLNWRVLPPLHLATMGFHFPRLLPIYPRLAAPDNRIEIRRCRITFDPVAMNYPAQEEDLQIVQMLVDSGADVNQQDTHLDYLYANGAANGAVKGIRWTPFLLAVSSAKWEVARLLLDKGADWNAISNSDEAGVRDLCSIKNVLDTYPVRSAEWEQRLLELATDTGLKEFLEQRQRNEKCREGGPSPKPEVQLLNACRKGHWTAVRELLTSHPTIAANRQDHFGPGAIHYAAEHAEPDMLLKLLERGADPNLVTTGTSYSALFIASGRGRLENMGSLLKYNAHIEHRGPAGYTPLLEAIYQKQYSAVSLLLDAGADLEVKTDDGSSALHLAISGGSMEILTALLDRGINPGSEDNFGTTPLHLACEQGLEFQVEEILKAEHPSTASLNLESPSLGTPLYIVTEKGHTNIIVKLLDAGANIDQTGPGNLLGSALMEASANDNVELVKIFLARGAALEVEGARFGSAAGTARAFRKYDVLKVLEEHASASQPRIEELAMEIDVDEEERPNGLKRGLTGGKGITLRKRAKMV